MSDMESALNHHSTPEGQAGAAVRNNRLGGHGQYFFLSKKLWVLKTCLQTYKKKYRL